MLIPSPALSLFSSIPLPQPVSSSFLGSACLSKPLFSFSPALVFLFASCRFRTFWRCWCPTLTAPMGWRSPHWTSGGEAVPRPPLSGLLLPASACPGRLCCGGDFVSGLFYVAVINPRSLFPVCCFTCLVDWVLPLPPPNPAPTIFYHLGEGEMLLGG